MKKIMAELDAAMTAPKIFHSLPVGIKIEAGRQTSNLMLQSRKANGDITNGIESITITDAGCIVIKTMEIK